MVKQPPAGKCPDTLVDPSPEVPVNARIRLCNFAVGSSQLLPAHKREIIDEITRATFNGLVGEVGCVGYASKLAYSDKGHTNQKLSETRAWAVKSFIEEHGKRVPHGLKVSISMGHGDQGAAQVDPTGNDGFFRAVDVNFFYSKKGTKPDPKPVPKPDPIPPPPLPTIKPCRDFIFQAIQVSSGSVSPGDVSVGMDVMEFAIRDTINNRTRYYFYFGGSGQIPTPDQMLGPLGTLLNLPLSASVGREGERKAFSIQHPITDMEDFASSHMFMMKNAMLVAAAGAGLGNTSFGGWYDFFLSPKAPNAAVPGHRVRLRFSTSKSVSMPSSGGIGSGYVVMMKPGYQPRRFPGENIL